MSGSRRALQDLFAPAGLRLDGDAPWDPKVHDDRFHGRVLALGSLGLGESYVDGWWDCDEIETFFYRLLSAGVPQSFHAWRDLPRIALARLTNAGRRSKAFEIGERHYDLGNDLYETMLDRRMTYSCGYWTGARNLDEAQEAKLDLICRKAGLQAGHARPRHRLRLGLSRRLRGGALRSFGRRHHGFERADRAWAPADRRAARRAPPSGLPRPRRDLRRDRVGRHVRARRAPATIGRSSTWRAGVSRRTASSCSTRSEPGSPPVACDPWIEKYIFPNSHVPSMAQIAAALENRFVIEDWQNIGPHYEPTLMAWFTNFRAGWDAAAGAIHGPLLPHVVVLPARLRGVLPRAVQRRLAARALARGAARRVRSGPLRRPVSPKRVVREVR